MNMLSNVLRVGPLSALLLFTIQTTHAGSATWLASPVSTDWNDPANWTAGGPPNGSTDTATFASSNTTGVSISAGTEVDGIVFNSGASAFTITMNPLLTISGSGVANNSGVLQNFVISSDSVGNGGSLSFTNNATAGSLATYTNTTDFLNAFGGNGTNFFGTSTAGEATFVNEGGPPNGGLGGNGATAFEGGSAGSGTFINNGGLDAGGLSGLTEFFTGSAENGTFINNGSTATGTAGGLTIFRGGSSAGNGVFMNHGSGVDGGSGGFTEFLDGIAANSTLIADGGLGEQGGGAIGFIGGSGGTPRVEIFDNGTLDISDGGFPNPVTIGSLEGNGLVWLGTSNLSVGSNNLSTTFSGLLQDGAFGGGGGTGGALTKIGRGKLTLSNASPYTGGTTVSKGTLLVTNRTGSATGTGTVAVNAGTLGGTGKISGAVTIGTTRNAAILAPGVGARPGKLTLLNTLTFKARGNYKVDLNSTLITADQVTAKGVTILNGATVTVDDLGAGTLTSGTVFTVINNTATTPIAGAFSNLTDGAMLVVGSNTYKANYEGGTGNDLTLTVQ